MFRLNNKAYQILADEIAKAASEDSLAGDIVAKIALKRLNKLRYQIGNPVDEIELKELFLDLFPNLSDKVWQKAAKANLPASQLWIVPKLALSFTGIAGFIWLLNLPYPMIRRPIARIAPIVLLPSYISMDRNYREAIANLEQADQLVNQATSSADLELGTEKVKQAQKNLNALPVWFLGYEPRPFMTWFHFSWLFTLDEFKAARASVGRMEATIFQEKNAMLRLEQSKAKIDRAKGDFQKATESSAKQQAIALWQAGIDELTEIPSDTLAGSQAKLKLNAYQRDFQQVSGLVAGNNRINISIAVAQKFAEQASNRCNNTPHQVKIWEQCASLWQQASQKLTSISVDDPGYLAAQTLIVNYESKLGEIEIAREDESQSEIAVEEAKSLIIDLPKQIDSNNRDIVIRQLQIIIDRLEKVRPNTTVYSEARQLMTLANNKLQQIQKL
jgi:hypothetical protein